MPDPLQRRNNPRNSFSCFARFRTLDAGPYDFERLCVTKDFSHDGLYFLALDRDVALRMKLLLRFPYLGDPSAANPECVVEVVRTMPLDLKRCGVGVRLISFHPPAKQNAVIIPEMSPSKDLTLNGIDLYA
ncbi:MAG: PilZ domain-containing protein [Candidatus Acidiferrales bacterium]|jgi:hypothetical protein